MRLQEQQRIIRKRTRMMIAEQLWYTQHDIAKDVLKVVLLLYKSSGIDADPNWIERVVKDEIGKIIERIMVKKQ